MCVVKLLNRKFKKIYLFRTNLLSRENKCPIEHRFDPCSNMEWKYGW